MVELLYERGMGMTDSGGRAYDVLVYGERRSDGTWDAWLEFRPSNGSGGLVLRTGRETTHASRHAVDDWARGLGPAFLEGAFERAFDRAAQHGY